MVRPKNIITRDLIHVVHKDISLRTPNVTTPATRYAFDDMAVDCKSFFDVRTLLKSDSKFPTQSQLIEEEDSTTVDYNTTTEDEDSNETDLVTIRSTPSSPITSPMRSTPSTSPNPTPTSNNDSSIVQALGLTPPADLELQRSYGQYDYRASTVCNFQDPSTSSTSSFTHFNFPPPLY